MKTRAVLAPLAAGLMLAAAPAAHANSTASAVSGGVLTVQGDDGGDTYTLDITSSSPSYAYKITSSATISGVPAGCTSAEAGKILTCGPGAGVSRLDLKAGAGNDTVTINDATDSYDDSSAGGLTVDGEAGNDTLTAGNVPLLTSVAGGADDDTFNGLNAGEDEFAAEAGNDTYHGGTADLPTVPGAGFDASSYQVNSVPDEYATSFSSTTAVNVSLDGAQNDSDGVGGTDNVGSDIEYLEGGAGNDTLSASGSPTYIRGEAGDDTVNGGAASDYLYGDDGSDTINAGGGDDEMYDGDFIPVLRPSSSPLPAAGNDKLNGGDGNDLMSVGPGTDDVVGGAGEDVLYYGRYQDQSYESFPTDFAPKYQNMTVSLDDQANDGPTGGSENDNIHSDVDDVDTAEIEGESFALGFGYGGPSFGDDTVTGSAAANRIETGGGKDTVNPGPGADTVVAGDGDDQISAADKYTDRIECGKGSDGASVDLAGANPARADVVTDCESITGVPLGAEVTPIGVPVPGATPKAATVSLSGSTTVKSKTFLKNYQLSVGVTANQAYTASGEALYSGAKIAKVGDFVIGSGSLKSGTGKRTLKVTIAKKYRSGVKRKLRTKAQRKKGVKVTVAVTVTNAAGQATKVNRSFKVKG